MIEASNSGSSEGLTAATRSMLTQLIHPLIDHPEQFWVDIVQRGDAATFVIQLAPDDMDKFVGRNMRTGRSLQVIAGAVGMKSQKRFSVTFQQNTCAGNSQAGADRQIAGT